MCTYTTTTSSTAATATTTTTSTPRVATTSALSSSLYSVSTISSGGSLLLGCGLWLTRKLNRDLAVENLLARELSDGFLSFVGGREIDESITNGTSGTWVGWD